MNNKLSKILSCLMIGAAISTSAVIPAAASPAYNNYYYYSDIHVADSNSFANAIANASNSSSTATIVLDGDIFLNKTVEIRSSVFIDLNGYSINLSNGAELAVGGKVYSHTETYTINHPGHYTKVPVVSRKESSPDEVYDDDGNLVGYEAAPDRKVVEFEDVWVPGWTETKTRDVYNYLDNLDISIKDGWINGSNGKDGKNGVENTYFGNCDGKDGGNGSNAIRLVSGTLKLDKIQITGGNGGNGGDGKYEAIAHVPFFTGNGGDGGKGGNAGSAVLIERRAANLIQGKSVTLKSGTPGKGGTGSEPNKNHWVGKGWHGRKGKDGKKAYAVQQ